MKIGIGVPQLGRFAEPAVTRDVAIAAERAGIDSLWAIDRLLVPLSPRSAYPSADGRLPAEQRRVLDPLVALTVAATVTERIGIGTNVLVAPWYPPVLLARSLATLDLVSGGRLTVGLGTGWSVDEYEAAGASMRERGTRVDEVLAVLTALWNGGEAELVTSRETIPASRPVVLPAQRPRPPVLLAAFTDGGLARVARDADGWIPTGLPLEIVGAMWAKVRADAERLGRDPDALRLVLRSSPTLTDGALGTGRSPFTGSRREVADDVRRARDLGVDELVLDLQGTATSPSELVDTALELAGDVRVAARA